MRIDTFLNNFFEQKEKAKSGAFLSEKYNFISQISKNIFKMLSYKMRNESEISFWVAGCKGN